MTIERALEIGDLTPGTRASGAHAEVYFDPSAFRCYEFSNVGSGWPMMAHNGRHFHLGSIPLDLADADALAEVVRGLEPLLATVAEGYDEKRDGNNTVGALTDAAREALEKAQEEYAEAIQGLPTFWDAGEWFAPVSAEAAREIVAKGVECWAADEIAIALGENAHLNPADVRVAGYDILERAVERADEEDEEGAAFIVAAKAILADR